MNYKQSYQEKKDQKIRPVIWGFIAFEMVMLFQTSHSNLGTIVSGILCSFMVVMYFSGTHRIKLTVSSSTMILYTLILVLSSIISASLRPSLIEFIVYVLIFVILSSMVLHEKESKWIVNAYVLTGVLYSLFTIHYRINNPLLYIHSRIVIFGSELDPNYIGLPLIISFSILLYDTFNNERRLYKIVALFIMVIAILLTSSRGNFLSLSICIISNVLHVLNNKNMTLYKKAIVVIAVIVALFFVYSYANSNYFYFLQRIFNFSSRDASNGRLILWTQAIDEWWKRPILGGGFEALSRRYNKGVHNTFLQVLCDTGIVGFALFASFITNMTKRCYRYNKCLFICLLGLLTHSFFLGAIATRCFWVTLMMVTMVVTNNEIKKRIGN